MASGVGQTVELSSLNVLDATHGKYNEDVNEEGLAVIDMRQELVGGRLAARLNDCEGKAVQARGDTSQATVEACNTFVDASGARGMSHEGPDTVDPSEGAAFEAEGQIIAATAADEDMPLEIGDFFEWLWLKHPDQAAAWNEWLEQDPDFMDGALSNEDAANHPVVPEEPMSDSLLVPGSINEQSENIGPDVAIARAHGATLDNEETAIVNAEIHKKPEMSVLHVSGYKGEVQFAMAGTNLVKKLSEENIDHVGNPPPPSPTKGKRKRQSLGVATNGPVRCEDRNDIVASPGTKKMRYDDLAHREDEARGPTKNQGQADIFADNVESVATRVEKPSVVVVDGPLQGRRGQDEAVSAASVTAEDMANATPTLMLEAVPAAETASQVAYTTSPAPADNTMPQAIGDGNQHIVYNGYILKIICPVDGCNYILDESNERAIGDHFYGKHGYKQNEKPLCKFPGCTPETSKQTASCECVRSLGRHMCSHMAGVDVFPCRVPGCTIPHKPFRRENIRNKHMKTHTAEAQEAAKALRKNIAAAAKAYNIAAAQAST